MSNENINNTQIPAFRNARGIFANENNSHMKTNQPIAEKETAEYVNKYRQKGLSRKQPKDSEESSISLDNVDLNQQSSLQKKQSTEDLSLENMLTSDLHDDDLSLGAPLSIKNFFKSVKTFSKRPTKSQKPRIEHLRHTKDTEVVVFERPTTPHANSLPPSASRSLPPVLDFHELFGSNTTVDDQSEHKVNKKKRERLPRSKTELKKPTNTSTSLRRLERQSSPTFDSGIRFHRCPGMFREVESEPDALQEFGSFDFSPTTRSSAGRKPRKSFTSLDNQHDELDALHF